MAIVRETVPLQSLWPRLALALSLLSLGVYVGSMFLPGAGLIPAAIPALLLGLFAYLVLSAPYQLVVDRHAGEVRVKALTGTTRVASLGDINGIRLREETRGSGKNRQRVYCLRLMVPGSDPELAAPSSYPEARRISERLARKLQVDIWDEGQGEPQQRDHKLVDAPWAEVAPVPEGPMPPAPGRLEMLESWPRLAVRLPRASPVLAICGLAVAGLPLLLLALAFTLPALAWVGLAGVLLVGLVLKLSPCLVNPILEAGPGALSVRTMLGLRSIDLRKLEEIRFVYGLLGGLALIDDHRVYLVYSELSWEEAEWLKLALAKAVRGA